MIKISIVSVTRLYLLLKEDSCVFCKRNLLMALRRCLVNMVEPTVIWRPLAGEKVVSSSFSACTVYCILIPH